MKNYLNIENLMQFLLFLIPISFYLGNMAINITVTAITVSALFLNWKAFSLFFNLNKKILIIILFFFLLLIFSTYSSNLKEELFQKSLIFLRFFLLIIALGFFIDQKKIHYNIFFTICLLATFFL